MDRLEAMGMLVEAVESGSLSAAGRKMKIPLPTLSRKISDLETLLGTRLLIRSTRNLAVTEAGAAYVAAAKRILEQIADAERAAAGEYSAPKGDLVVAAPIAFGRLHVLPIVTEFLDRYREINVRLLLSDSNARLIDEHVDMAIRIGPLPDSAMTATRVGEVRYVVCASPSFLAAHGAPATPADLARLDCVAHDFGAPAKKWAFKRPDAKAVTTAAIRPRLSVTTAEAAIDAAIAGAGVTRVISYQAAAAVARGELRIVLAQYEPEPLPVSVLHAAQGALPLKMRTFLDFCAPRLRQALGAAKPG